MMAYTGHGNAYVWHLVEPTSVFDRGETKSALNFFPEARPVAKAWATLEEELDADKFRFAAKRGIPRTILPPAVKLLDESMLMKIAGRTPKSAWLFSPRLIPGADAIYRLSWPAYRVDGRAAFLICAVCTKWWGAVILCEVDKDYLSGKWRLGRTARRDFTHWRDDKLFIDEWP